MLYAKQRPHSTWYPEKTDKTKFKKNSQKKPTTR